MFRKRKNPFELMNQIDSMFENFGSMIPTNFNQDLIFGKINTESGSDETGNWTKQSFVSEDGSFSITSVVKTNSDFIKKDGTKMESLKAKLEKAVEKQDFEEAVRLRDEIKKFEKNKSKIESLKSELEKSIKNQEFEKSIELRDKLKELE